jgi:uncharacterized membrane protein
MLVVGFDPDAEYRGAILDELDNLTTHGVIRVLDLLFVRKQEDGVLLAMEASDLDLDERVKYGSIIGGLIGLGRGGVAGAITGAEEGAAAAVTRAYGLSPADIEEIAADLKPNEAVGLLLFEHKWAAHLKEAVRSTGGYPIAQGFLTPEALMMIGQEVEAMMEAEIAIEVAEAAKGAALLDALTTIELAEQVKAVAVAEAMQALIVAGIIEEAAMQKAFDTLVVAGLISEDVLMEAEAAVAAADAEMNDARAAINKALAGAA